VRVIVRVCACDCVRVIVCVPSLCEDLLSSVDQPLKIARDKVVGKDYLLCDYNRDGDSYRCSTEYRDLYFEGGVSSVYLWDLDHGFAGVILIKKAGDGSKKIKGCWDSIHVVEVQVRAGAPLPVQTGINNVNCFYLPNLGNMDMENKIRSTLNEIYFGKTKDIVNGLRSVQMLADKSKQEALKNDLMQVLSQRSKQQS
uniref:F-actin-capping protein subunit beta n=1 Tax=Sinocyclocheilus rhinocerous TaxID=307959 RepID=A0A673N741_9TELE